MKNYVVTVNGNRYEVQVEEVKGDFPAASQAAAPVAAPAPKKAAAPKKVEAKEGEKIEAPMPGNILRINVNDGDSVKEGDTLLILEAMKMENEIKAPRDGKVVQIITSAGTQVNTGDPLVVIE